MNSNFYIEAMVDNIPTRMSLGKGATIADAQVAYNYLVAALRAGHEVWIDCHDPAVVVPVDRVFKDLEGFTIEVHTSAMIDTLYHSYDVLELSPVGYTIHATVELHPNPCTE